MIYRKPVYYDQFHCLGDRCPDTCCCGWAIEIDEDSLNRYAKAPGETGRRLRNAVDWLDESFLQDEKGCLMQTENGLCMIQKEWGEEALCETCASFPRHTEEYPELRDRSISLACPEAARLILSTSQYYPLQSESKEEEDDLEYGEIDKEYMKDLLQEQDRLSCMLFRKEIPLDERIRRICREADLWQKAQESRQDSPEDRGMNTDTDAGVDTETPSARQERMRKELETLMELEVIDSEWTDRMEETGRFLWEHSAEEYAVIRKEFQASFCLKPEWNRNSSIIQERKVLQLGEETLRSDEKVLRSGEKEIRPDETTLTLPVIRERIMAYFLYVYALGAIYDEELAGKVRMGVFFADWLEELLMIRWWNEGRTLSFGELAKTAGRLSRQVEHSDENLNTIEELLVTG